jgi:hypothetical protein
MKFNDLRDESRFFLKILILAAKEIIEVLKDTRHIYVCEVGDHVSKVYLDEMKNLMKKNKPKKKGGKKSKKSKKK